MSLSDFCDEMDRDLAAPPSIKAPFNWPGSKSKLVECITPHLPYHDAYIEPFGGSGAVMLARHPSELEVFNDRFAGVCAFYRCIRNPILYEKLMQWLDFTVHSREEWEHCRDTWENCEDDVERAAKWYYSATYSFGGIGRSFSRSVKAPSAIAGKISEKLPLFWPIHQRMRKVQVENLEWLEIMDTYDTHHSVFYLDPPYIGTSMSLDEHKRILYRIHRTKGFVAISGYHHPLYDAQPWDRVIEFPHVVTVEKERVMEVLFIKGVRI